MSSRIKDARESDEHNICKALRDAGSRICCTTDGWTSVAMHSYVVITAHFITPDWTMRGLTISFEEVPESHTGENLAEKFIEIAKKYGIEEKISSIISDNANNAMLGINLAAKRLSTSENQILPLRCLTHILHLVASAGFESLAGPMAKLKAIVTKIRSSTTAPATLKGFCVPHKETYSKPMTDTPTRWNSTLAMIESMIGMQKSLASLAPNFPVLSSEEWAKLEEIRALLQPFKLASEHLSGSSYCTLSNGGFVARWLLAHLQAHADKDLFKAREDKDLKVDVEAMIKKLLKYMGDFEEQSLLPSFFDPRYLHQLATHDKISAVNAIKKLLPRPDPCNGPPAETPPKAKELL